MKLNKQSTQGVAEGVEVDNEEAVPGYIKRNITLVCGFVGNLVVNFVGELETQPMFKSCNYFGIVQNRICLMQKFVDSIIIWVIFHLLSTQTHES